MRLAVDGTLPTAESITLLNLGLNSGKYEHPYQVENLGLNSGKYEHPYQVENLNLGG
jgi:hypothetical protein